MIVKLKEAIKKLQLNKPVWADWLNCPTCKKTYKKEDIEKEVFLATDRIFCSLECAIEDKHWFYCTCIFCGPKYFSTRTEKYKEFYKNVEKFLDEYFKK